MSHCESCANISECMSDGCESARMLNWLRNSFGNAISFYGEDGRRHLICGAIKFAEMVRKELPDHRIWPMAVIFPDAPQDPPGDHRDQVGGGRACGDRGSSDGLALVEGMK